MNTILNVSHSSSDVSTQLEDACRNLPKFVANFVDENGYQAFIQNMHKTVESYEHIRKTGYFSETSAQQLITQKKGLRAKIRILSCARAYASSEVPHSVGAVIW